MSIRLPVGGPDRAIHRRNLVAQGGFLDGGLTIQPPGTRADRPKYIGNDLVSFIYSGRGGACL